MTPCFACGLVAPCTPYRLGGRGLALVYLCAECGASFEETVTAWLEARQARPRQVELFAEVAS